jgi:hypothetical protein
MNNIHSNTTFLNEAIDKKTDVEDEKTDLILANMIDLRKTMSDVLSLLLGAKKNSVIDQALFRILQFFDVDRVYIGTFDEQTHTVDFTNEVTCDGIISMREDYCVNSRKTRFLGGTTVSKRAWISLFMMSLKCRKRRRVSSIF